MIEAETKEHKGDGMKKASLAIIALALALTACSGSKKAESTAETGTASAETAAESTMASNEDGGKAETAEAASITETVVLDREGLKITAKELDMNGSLGPVLKLLIENETNQNVTVQIRDMSVNGYMISPLMSSMVDKGETKEDVIGFSSRELKLSGITTFAELAFRFYVFDSDTMEAVYDSEPVALKTSAAAGYQEKFDDSGDLAYEGDGVKLVVKGKFEKEDGFGPGILFYIENNSDKNIEIQATDVSVNGAALDPILSAKVAAGKHAISAMSFFDNQLDDQKIDAIRKAELRFIIVDTDTMEKLRETDLLQVKF